MTTHTLATEQMRKFVDAVGRVHGPEIAGDQFTTKQLQRTTEQIGGLRDWPKITDDPQTNFAVGYTIENGDEEPTYDERLYADAVEAFRANGSFA